MIEIIFSILPKLRSFLAASRNRREEKRFRAAHQKLIRYLSKFNDLKVCTGIFQGLQYVNLELKGKVPSALIPKLLGSYEDELAGVMDEICLAGYSEIIDVGCAEGYYAIGFARKLPEAIIYAFDTNTNAAELCKEMARANNVEDRLVVGGNCLPETLNEISVRRKGLIFCDCEGFELDLLDTVKFTEFKKFDILVELHDFIDPAISEEIMTRFKHTHTITIIKSVSAKDPGRYPVLNGFKPYEQRLALAEYRPCIMEWAYMKAVGG